MGCQARYGTIAIGAYMAHQPGTHQAAFLDQYRPQWDRGGARGPRTWKDRNRWYSLWSFGCRVGAGAPIGSDGAGWYDLSQKDLFEPYSCDGEGTQSTRFIRGVTRDAGGAPLGGCMVQGFVTATDTFVGQVESHADGTYTLATDTLPGVAHYLVAYKPGAPDVAGTSVNTITSTHVDGS